MPLNREEEEMNSGIWLFGMMLGQKKPRCSHQHLTRPLNSKEIYAQPCFLCNVFCNCDKTKTYPDVLVRTADFKTVRLGGYVVSGSWALQMFLKRKLLQMEKSNKEKTDKETFGTGPVNPLNGLSKEKRNGINGLQYLACMNLNDKSCKGQEEETVPLAEIFQFNSEVVDLRNEDGSPDLSMTSEILDICQRFLAQHLDDVDETVNAEVRAVKFFNTALEFRPKPGPVKYFAYEDWEEDLFDVDGAVLSDLWQAAQRELKIPDMTFALDKWFALFRGRPADDTFGRALYSILPVNPEDREILYVYSYSNRNYTADPVDTCEEYEDFYDNQWSNVRVQSKHGLPERYQTVYHEHHKFPRRYQWKRGAIAGYDQEPGHVNYYIRNSQEEWEPLAKFPIVKCSDRMKKKLYS